MEKFELGRMKKKLQYSDYGIKMNIMRILSKCKEWKMLGTILK